MSYIIYSVLFFVVFLSIGHKWEMARKKYIPWTIFMVIVGNLVLYGLDSNYPELHILVKLGLAATIPVVLTILIISYYFFRDPDRNSPQVENTILSPADGKVIYIKEIINGEFPLAVKGKNKIPLSDFINDEFIADKGLQIGIAMSFLHVHVNRSPVKGKVKKIIRVPGAFNSLKHIKSLLENERVFTQIDSADVNVGMVQIASRLVRRIISYKKEDEMIGKGERIGIIKFGSQVDLLVDTSTLKDVDVEVEVGQEVKAGLTIVAKYK